MELQPETFDISGTYNIQHMFSEHSKSLLLPDGRADFFSDIREEDMRAYIGTPTYTHDEYETDEKGYGDEWYFKAPSGNTVAVGFRWGTSRLRGDNRTTVEDVVQLIDFLQSAMAEE